MNKYHQHRASVLRAVSFFPKSGRRVKEPIRQDDYIAAPPPINLSAHPVGDCLVWLYALTEDGYGRATFPQKEQLAHRQAFKQSRGRKTEADVLHLCHRRFCIQPSHLYSGDAQENADDRRLYRDDGLDLRLHSRKSETVRSVANYRWPSPHIQQVTLKTLIPVEHKCEYVIPAGSVRICPICEQPEDPRLQAEEMQRDLQPLPDSGDTTHIVTTNRRSFGEFSDGVSLRLDSQTTFAIAKNRGELRRIEKARQQSYNGPVLLWSEPLDFAKSASKTIHKDTGPLYGPALIVTTVSRSLRVPQSPLDAISLNVLEMSRQLREYHKSK